VQAAERTTPSGAESQVAATDDTKPLATISDVLRDPQFRAVADGLAAAGPSGSAQGDLHTQRGIALRRSWEMTNAFVRQSGLGYEIPAPVGQIVTTHGYNVTNPADPRAGEVIQRVNIYSNSPPEDVTTTTKSVYVPLRPIDEDAAQTLIQAGVRLMEARQFDSAEARFRAALSLAPSNAEAAWRLQVLAIAPTNIEFEVQFAEITERGSDDLGLDWLFGQSPTNNPALQSGPATNLLTEAGSPSGPNLRVDLLRTEGQSAALTEAQFAALRKRLEGRGGVGFLAAPKLITQAGRQARIAVSDMRNIVSGVGTTQGSTTNQAGIGYQTEQIATGPSVDLVATVEGGTTRLAIVAKVTEFLGYDQPKPGQEVKAASPGGKLVKGVMPLPHLRVRSTQADVSAGAGETVVLRGPLASDTQLWKDKVVGLRDLPLLGRLFRSAGTNVVRKRLYVFVTPSRVSATGEKQ